MVFVAVAVTGVLFFLFAFLMELKPALTDVIRKRVLWAFSAPVTNEVRESLVRRRCLLVFVDVPGACDSWNLIFVQEESSAITLSWRIRATITEVICVSVAFDCLFLSFAS